MKSDVKGGIVKKRNLQILHRSQKAQTYCVSYMKAYSECFIYELLLMVIHLSKCV